MIEETISQIRAIILRENKLVREINSLVVSSKNSDAGERKMIENQMEQLRVSLQKANSELAQNLSALNLAKPLAKKEFGQERINFKDKNITDLDKEILERLKKKKEKIEVKKERKPNFYIKLANQLFSERVLKLVKEQKMKSLEKDLIKSNLRYTPATYISILALTTLVSAIVSVLLFIFLIFFVVSPDLPIITLATGGILSRIVSSIWTIILIPSLTFLFMYFYPSLEKKSLERKIDQELPFATIHMAAISGSMIEPTRIFSIISSTKEYPDIEKEFNKLLNQINIYGYDLVTALKDSASNSPSQKLAELFNGMATTITSGGSLYEFFEKRSQSMLFEYKLDREKNTKIAETSMDIYISVVIAAPMILMLLLMMMKISGLGVSLSTSLITLLVVGGVSVINIFFLMFLQLRRS